MKYFTIDYLRVNAEDIQTTVKGSKQGYEWIKFWALIGG